MNSAAVCGKRDEQHSPSLDRRMLCALHDDDEERQTLLLLQHMIEIASHELRAGDIVVFSLFPLEDVESCSSEGKRFSACCMMRVHYHGHKFS